MADLFDKNVVGAAVARIIRETLASSDATDAVKKVDSEEASSEGLVKLVHSRDVNCAPFPFDIGEAKMGTSASDILTSGESPRLGAGIMEVRGVSFPWTFGYDEVEYVIEGVLCITSNGKKNTATAGDVIYIRKGTSIEFSSPSRARFLYVTYPADWQNNG